MLMYILLMRNITVNALLPVGKLLSEPFKLGSLTDADHSQYQRRNEPYKYE